MLCKANLWMEYPQDGYLVESTLCHKKVVHQTHGDNFVNF